MQYFQRRADCDDPETIIELDRLHRETFGVTAPITDAGGCIFECGAWWLVHPEHPDHHPIGFCGIVPSTYGKEYAYLKRAGILKEHQGQGLQKRMIYIREQWARKEGFHWVITNCINDNVASMNSLIARGYRTWWPDPPWDLKTAVYFRKQLQAL